MGTSGSYGGSSSKDWKNVRNEWGKTTPGSPPGEKRPPKDGDKSKDTPPKEKEQKPDKAFDALGNAIANALLSGDKVARISSPPNFTLQSVVSRSGRGSGGGGGGGGGGSGGGSSSGSSGRSGRQVIRQAARGGAAIGAATAYRARDAAALGQYGITLAELDSLTPRNRCARLMDLVLGEPGHPDEAAVRKAAYQQIKKIVLDSTVASTVESLRNFVGEMTMQLALVELRDQILSGSTSPKDATLKERGLRQWISSKLKKLNLAKYGQVSASDCHQAAARLAQDALKLLRRR